MVNFKAKTAKENKREKGIALIFTLIMLSLLLILALSFALDSMFEQKAAYNSANASAANLAAKAELNQILSFLENGSPNFSNSTVYSGGGSSGEHNSVHDRDMLLQDTSSPIDYNSLLLTEGVINTSNINELCFSAAEADRISWTYNKDADGKIIGRTAFVAIAQEKIPLSSLISKTVDESNGQTATFAEQRIGKEVSEINVRNALYPENSGDAAATYTITPAMADVLNWKIGETGVTSNRTAGKYTGTWPEYDTLFGSSYLDLTNKIADATNRTNFEDNFEDTFSLDVLQDQEAFWVDLDNDGIINSDLGSGADYELYKRFDLTRADWDTSESVAKSFVIKNIMLSAFGSTIPTLEMQKWTDEDSFDDTSDANYFDKWSKGIPWLACFGYMSDGTAYTSTELDAVKGTFSSPYDRACQIAANLKDYSDTDDIPSSDTKPSQWLSTTPTFTGNERTPYINKIGIKIASTFTKDALGGDDFDYTLTINAKPYVGIIDIYRNKYPNDLTIKVQGTVTVAARFGGTGSFTTLAPIDIDKDITIDALNNWPVDGYSHFVGSSSSSSDVSHMKTLNGDYTGDVKVVDVSITRVVLHDGSGNGYDYVKGLNLVPNSTSGDIPALSGVSSDGDSGNFWVGFEVNDPRQNLNKDDWVILTPKAGDDLTSIFAINAAGECLPNSTNTNTTFVGSGSPAIVAPNTNDPDLYDPESTNDPAAGNLSTAYIRNAPMESPWELGFIHRGKMWQTLNLKKYDSSKANAKATINGKYYIAGGGLYKDGDANILDQVKMTKSPSSSEKINIATQEDNILNALFSQINLGCVSTISRGDIYSSSDPDFPFKQTNHMTISSMATGGTAIDPYTLFYDSTPNSYQTLISDIKSVGGLTRAAYADKLAVFAATVGTNDATQEELIGKIINLTKVNLTPGDGNYSIVIVSQTIKDVGGNGTDIEIYKTPADGSTAQSVLCQLGRFDVKGTDDNWKKNSYGDDITATQKILVKTSKVNGKIKITKLQYIE